MEQELTEIRIRLLCCSQFNFHFHRSTFATSQLVAQPFRGKLLNDGKASAFCMGSFGNIRSNGTNLMKKCERELEILHITIYAYNELHKYDYYVKNRIGVMLHHTDESIWHPAFFQIMSQIGTSHGRLFQPRLQVSPYVILGLRQLRRVSRQSSLYNTVAIGVVERNGGDNNDNAAVQ